MLNVELVAAFQRLVVDVKARALREHADDGRKALVVTGRPAERSYDYRLPKPASPEAAEPQLRVERMMARLESERDRRRFHLRQQTDVPVFEIIRHVMGLSRFMLEA